MKAGDRTQSRKYWKLSLGLATLIPFCLGTAVAQTTYTVTDLGTLGGTLSSPADINDKGWVNGLSTLLGDQNEHATLWVEGLKIDLGTLGGPNSSSFLPLNARGEVAGFAETSTPDPNGEDACGFGTHLICLPFLWQRGVIAPLPTLGGNNGQAHEVNNRGQVAGFAENATLDPTCVAPQVLQFKPVVWEKGEVRELPTFGGDPDGSAVAMGDKGPALAASSVPFEIDGSVKSSMKEL